MSNNKVLVLALDGVEHSLVRRWAEEGRLPNIQALFRRGSAATVTNPPGISGATWPTLHTGVNAGKHGYYYFSQLEPGTYRTRTLSRSDVHGTPFWCTLSEAGKRVAVFDVPKSHPPKHLNGFLIADWGNHDGDIFEGCKTWPPELGRKLNRRFGPDPLKNRSFGIRGPQDCRSFINTLKANVRRKSEAVSALMAEDDWDLFYACWDDGHWAGHFGWSQHDPAHPNHDPKLAALMGDPMDHVLRTLDHSFGELIKRAGPGVHVMFLCSHGMGPGYRTAKTLDPILRRLEGRPSTARKETYSRLRSVWDALPARLHRPLTRLKNEVRENIMAKDRARRRWFTLPVNHDGGLVRLNVVGREPQGIIQPGEEYEATLDYLIKELKAVIDLDTGEPVVKQVYRVQALAQGERRHLLPDLAVRWNATRTAKRIGSPSIGELSESISATRTGEHLPDGLLLSAAPGGHSAPDITMHAEDFAGTVAAALGVKLEGIEGDPVSGLLSPNRMSSEIK